MNARNHHYLPQCYLKRFTKGCSKKSKLVVYDIHERKVFETIPRNVGSARDFNRVDFKGLDPNSIENAMAVFENKVDNAIKEVEETKRFQGDSKNTLLSFLSLVNVRSPKMREHWRKNQEKVFKKIFDLSLETEDRWSSITNNMQSHGYDTRSGFDYLTMKELHESGCCEFDVTREHQLHREFISLEVIFNSLLERSWMLLEASEQSGPFITTDNPVVLSWITPNHVPSIYQNSPGHGLSETRVYFPLSKKLALIGEFGSLCDYMIAPDQLVASLNHVELFYLDRQLYVPKRQFYILDHVGKRIDGGSCMRKQW